MDTGRRACVFGCVRPETGFVAIKTLPLSPVSLMPCCLRLFAIAGALAFAGLMRAQAPEAAELPLPENYFPALKTLLDAAARQSPQMIAHNAAEAVAEAQHLIARAGQLPQVGGYFNYLPWDRDYRKADPNSPYTSQKSQYHLNVVQPLYHWGALEASTRISELQQRITKGETAQAYRELASDIRRQYLGLIVAKAGLARARVALEMAQKQAEVAKGRFERREISESELLPQTLGAERAQLTIDQAVDDYESSKRMLARLAGVDAIAEDQVPDAIPDVTVPLDHLDALLAQYAAQDEPPSPSLQNLHDRIEIEKLNYRIADARLKPKVNLLAGSSEDEQSYTANVGQKYGVTSFYTGVQINWSIFDGFATKGTKLAALTRRREFERNYKRLSAELVEQAREQLRQLRFSARGLAIAQQLLAASDNAVKTVSGNVERGFASAADLATARLGNTDARIAAYRARIDLLMRTADFLATLQKDPVLSNLSVQRP
jgi:outer membrane protein TolC